MTQRRDSLRITLGLNVRRLRLARGWSQEDLGERANLSQVYISQVERAEQAATVDVIEALSKALKAHPVELLGTEQ